MRGRKKLVDRPRQIAVRIPNSVYARVHARLVDPLAFRAEYGSMNGLITQLLKQWLGDKEDERHSDDNGAAPSNGPGGGSGSPTGPS